MKREAFFSGYKVYNCDFRDIEINGNINIAILDPPFDYDYSNLIDIDADCICVFSRGAKVLPYLSAKISEGYGYHCIVNLTPANGSNAPLLPSNTFELIHILRRKNFYFCHSFALKVLKKQGLKAPAVINFGRPTTGKNYYKYAKPIRVMCYLMAYAPPQANVFDPFMGIGTSLLASIYRGNNYIGCDISDICKKRNYASLFDEIEYL